MLLTNTWGFVRAPLRRWLPRLTEPQILEFQRFYFNKPMLADRLTELLRADEDTEAA